MGNKSKLNLLCLIVGSNQGNRILLHVMRANPHMYFYSECVFFSVCCLYFHSRVALAAFGALFRVALYKYHPILLMDL